MGAVLASRDWMLGLGAGGCCWLVGWRWWLWIAMVGQDVDGSAKIDVACAKAR